MTARPPDGPALCPSAPGTPGAVLIGVVEADGRVANLGTPLPVDAEFLDAARAYGPPERRFRFSAPCAEGRCVQWDGRGCGLIDHIYDQLEKAGAVEAPASLRACAIRPGCRWWRQRGAAACAVCPLVVTDGEERAVDLAPATEPPQERSSPPARAGRRRPRPLAVGYPAAGNDTTELS